MLDCKHAGPSLLPPSPPGRGLGPHSKPGQEAEKARVGRGEGVGLGCPGVGRGEGPRNLATRGAQLVQDPLASTPPVLRHTNPE